MDETNLCYGIEGEKEPHRVTTPVSADHLCLSCETNLIHQIEQQEGL